MCDNEFMELGPYSFDSSFFLAPMAGISQMPFRRIVRELGACAAPTELISAEGLIRESKRTLEYLRHDPVTEYPFYVQLFGGEPGKMAQAALVAQKWGARILDINMGCPVPKVTRGGGGAALMSEPERACAIVSQVCQATGLPVTVKIRSGWDSQTSQQAPCFAQNLEQAGACAITIHPRTRAQGYSGRADWSVIRAVKQAVQIPVIGNGDVTCRADGERMRKETGCDGVMVGRGALGNPWIFRELKGGKACTAEERKRVVLRHLEEHVALFSNQSAGVRSFRKLLLWYARGIPGAALWRNSLLTLENMAEVQQAIESFF